MAAEESAATESEQTFNLSRRLTCGRVLFVCFSFLGTLMPRQISACSHPLDTDVLVLGAGMAGVSAAKKLSDRGVKKFLIIEGGSDIGGRVKAVEFGGVNIELGANWIQGLFSNGSTEKNPLWAMKEKAKLQGSITNFFDLAVHGPLGHKVQPGVVNSIVARLNASSRAMTALSRRLQQEGMSDLKMRSALRFASWKPRSSVENFIEWFRTDFCFAESPSATSLVNNFPQYTYHHYGPYEYFVWDQRGFSTIIKGLANEYLTPDYKSDPRLHLNEVVKKIEWSDSCVCATVEKVDNSSHTYCAKSAIHTFSLGTLQAGTVEFVPPLPQNKRLAINTVDMAYYLKVFARFNHSFWDNAEYVGFGAYQRGYYPLIQPLDVGNGKFFPTKPSILLMTVTGTQAERVARQPKSLTMSEIHQVLQTMYGEGASPPIDIYVPDWIENPLFHGMYSNWPPDFNSKLLESLLKHVGSLVFSGEAMSPNSTGFVHSAYLSGIDGAEQALKFLKQQSPQSQLPRSSHPDSAFRANYLFVVIGICLIFLFKMYQQFFSIL